MDRKRTARKNDAFDVRSDFGHGIVGVNFAIYVELPHAPRYKLRVLGAEVENQYGFLHGAKIARPR